MDKWERRDQKRRKEIGFDSDEKNGYTREMKMRPKGKKDHRKGFIEEADILQERLEQEF